ncbi:uncharacterized protein [Neodiprion pinetum]|uniref:uncharacterized protein n=1 Tax=Neodiprion pinetum TaxID=441929 RepID=UPI0037195630
MDNYCFIRNDRSGKVEGGVGVYIHKSLECKVLAASPSLFSNSPEFLILEIKSQCNKALFSTIYRRPKGALLEDFLTQFETFSHSYTNIIITGDLNCNLSSDNFEARYLHEFIFSHSLFLVPHGNTHHTSHSESWLDVAIIDSSENLLSFTKTETPLIAGHDLIELNYKLFIPQPAVNVKKYRDFGNCDVSTLSDTLKHNLSNPVLESAVCPNELASVLCESILDALNCHAPVVPREIKKPPAGWFTPVIKQRIKSRSRLYTLAKRTKSRAILNQYRTLRRDIKLEIKSAKNTYFKSRLLNLTDMSSVWSELERLGLVLGKSTSTSPLHHFAAHQLNTKVEPPSSEADTRPVANLSHLSKVFERAVANQLNLYLERFTLLDPFQAGFRKSHSTQTVLLKVLDHIRNATDSRYVTILLLFDFSKAFDSINHCLVLTKLKRYGVSNEAIKWFHSYLTGRTQAEQDPNNTQSSFLQNLSGVPQDSARGPLLFLIFINDIAQDFLHTKHVVFADGLQIYLHIPPDDVLSAIDKITSDADAVSNWASRNGLKLNIGKTKAIILGSSAYVEQLRLRNLPTIVINSLSVPYVETILQTSVPSYLREFFPELDPTICRSSRLAIATPVSCLAVPTHRTSTLQNSFALSALYLWNSLPLSIRSASSLDIFKTRLLSHLLAAESITIRNAE